MASYTYFGDALNALERLGITDIILPFLLIFTVVFAVLQKTKILGAEKKNLNVIIALVLGLAVIIPHATNAYPPGADVVDIINASLPQIALVLVIILGLMIMMGLWGVSPAWKGPLTGIIMIVSFIVVIAIFGSAAGFISIPEMFDSPELQALIVIFIFFYMIFKAVTSEGEKTKGESILEGIGKFFEKSK